MGEKIYFLVGRTIVYVFTPFITKNVDKTDAIPV